MACEADKLLLQAYWDGELDLVRALEIEEHLKACADCAQELRNQRTLRAALRSGVLYRPAPQLLRERIIAATGQEAAGSVGAGRARDLVARRPALRRPALEWLAIAAALVIVVLVGIKIASGPWSFRQNDVIAQEIVASHIRSLQPGHLYDVESTDQHTVKPWFDGKLDFSPPVRDVADQGFPLVGGRLDYVGKRAVAALVFQRRKHIINLFVWPEDSSGTPLMAGNQRQESRDGYNLLEWREGDMRLCAVSDVSADDLKRFMQSFKD